MLCSMMTSHAQVATAVIVQIKHIHRTVTYEIAKPGVSTLGPVAELKQSTVTLRKVPVAIVHVP